MDIKVTTVNNIPIIERKDDGGRVTAVLSLGEWIKITEAEITELKGQVQYLTNILIRENNH